MDVRWHRSSGDLCIAYNREILLDHNLRKVNKVSSLAPRFFFSFWTIHFNPFYSRPRDINIFVLHPIFIPRTLSSVSQRYHLRSYHSHSHGSYHLILLYIRCLFLPRELVAFRWECFLAASQNPLLSDLDGTMSVHVGDSRFRILGAAETSTCVSPICRFLRRSGEARSYTGCPSSDRFGADGFYIDKNYCLFRI